MSFGDYLKTVRSDTNVNQTQMAKILDISRTAIKLIENGSTKYPSKKVLHNLSSFLNKPEIEVMLRILFTEVNLDDQTSDKLCIYRYLTHMYLEGWNIDQAPYRYIISEDYYHEFDGRIIKKRQPKNIAIVTGFARFLSRIDDVKSANDALVYMGDAMAIVSSVLDEFRNVHIIFDYNNKEQKQKFGYFRNLQYRTHSFGIRYILYDAIKDQVIDEVKYK